MRLTRQFVYITILALLLSVYTITPIAADPVPAWIVEFAFIEDLYNWPDAQQAIDRQAITRAILDLCAPAPNAIASDQWGPETNFRVWFNIIPNKQTCTKQKVQEYWDREVPKNIHFLRTLKIIEPPVMFNAALCARGPYQEPYVVCKSVDTGCPECPEGRACTLDEECESKKCLQSRCSSASFYTYSFYTIMIVFMAILSIVYTQ